MALYVNGDSDAGRIRWENKTPRNMYVNGVIAMNYREQIFEQSGTFQVPQGVTEITICMCGAGGNGALQSTYSTYELGGGYAGQVVTRTITGLTEGSLIDVIVGTVGELADSTRDTYFGTVKALGGAHGNKAVTSTGYKGNGGSSYFSCSNETNSDGLTKTDVYGTNYGGQAGLFGKGGNGGDYPIKGENGGVGAGGGASAGSIGQGGRGQCNISWA